MTRSRWRPRSLLASSRLITIDFRGGDDSPLDGVRVVRRRPCSARWSGRPPPSSARSATRSTASAGSDDGQDEARRAERGERRTLERRLRTSELDREPGRRSSTTCCSSPASGATGSLPGAGHRDRCRRRTSPGPSRIDAGSRDGITAGHDGAQRRRPGRPGQDRRPDDRHRAARRSTRRRRSACGSRARWRSAFATGRGRRRDLELQLLDPPVHRRARATGS